MVGIEGIGGVSEPANTKTPVRRGPTVRPEQDSRTRSADGAQFTPEAVEAAGRGRLAATGTPGEIRAERIAKAKENIEQGVYRIHEVVLQVADRIGRFVD